MCTRAFSRNFFAPLVYVVFSRICFYSVNFSRTFCFLCLEMKSNIVYARAKAAILRLSGHSVKEIAKFLTHETERWGEQLVEKRINFEYKPRSGRPFVLTNCARKSIKKAKYKQNNISWSQSHWEHLEYHWRDNVQRCSTQNDERDEKVTTFCMEKLLTR